MGTCAPYPWASSMQPKLVPSWCLFGWPAHPQAPRTSVPLTSDSKKHVPTACPSSGHCGHLDGGKEAFLFLAFSRGMPMKGFLASRLSHSDRARACSVLRRHQPVHSTKPLLGTGCLGGWAGGGSKRKKDSSPAPGCGAGVLDPRSALSLMFRKYGFKHFLICPACFHDAIRHA